MSECVLHWNLTFLHTNRECKEITEQHLGNCGWLIKTIGTLFIIAITFENQVNVILKILQHPMFLDLNMKGVMTDTTRPGN